MVAPVISISSNTSEESVGSHALRVILFGDILAIIHVIPEVPVVPADPIVTPDVGTVSVVSPAGVLDLVDYSPSSDSDPSEDSLPPAPDLPLVSPFLCFDDTEADGESELAEQRPVSSSHDTLAPFLEFPLAPVVAPPGIRRRSATLVRPSEAIPFGRPYRTHLNRPRKLLTVRKRVRPIHACRLAWRRVSHHSSDRHSSPDSSSSSAPSDHSLFRHTPPETTDADSSTPHMFVHRSLARTPRHNEAFRRWRSAPLSTPYPPTTSESSVFSIIDSIGDVRFPGRYARVYAMESADILSTIGPSFSLFFQILACLVMAASVISISSNTSEESVGSHAPRVILFGAIPAIIHVIPEVPVVPADPIVTLDVGTVSVVSPAGVLDLVDYLPSSDSDPSEDSLPLARDLPLVLPFLCSDDTEADGEFEPAEQRPVSSSHDTLAPFSEFPLAPEEFCQVRRDRDDTRKRLKRLESTMTITRSGMTPEAIEELINRRVEEALAAHEATRAANALEAENQSQNGSDGDNGNGGNGDGENGNGENGNGGNGNPNENGRGDRPVARECTYQDFMKCQPLNFKGTKGVVRLIRWFEKMETVFHISNCPEKSQVKYATCTLLNSALTWWNSHKRNIGTEAAFAMS
ncbi:hypothetical protein Tco_1032463 [Tanacetum coccineum]|uniref:Reverse transcriptase domain-containing protein n=1 Tax=Tanacetum coccineum TaxID=301880 RepID=A0ABQ5GE87_9ASTR